MRDVIAIRDDYLVETPEAPEAREGGQYVISSALRTLQVLTAFGEPPHRLGLADIVTRLGLEKNQAYRSLKTLEAAGYLDATDDGRFVLGALLAELKIAATRSRGASFLEAAAPVMDRLNSQTEETVHLFMRVGDQALCVDKRDSPQSVRLVAVLGRTFPLHAGAVPKAILASLSEDERERILDSLGSLPRFTDKTITDRAKLTALLDQVKTQGFAVSDEDFDSAAKGVGAAVFGDDGSVVGGISVGGPSYRITDDVLARFAQLVRAAAGDITRGMALAGKL
ncbi:MAG: IclR family transcriptional regulator [Trueperaceae bacterium]|nr:IclR family transcriptional regulator [Trueperaceae bacterium]